MNNSKENYVLLTLCYLIQAIMLAGHTIPKCQKMSRQNTFEILLLNDANMIGEHQETRMKMPNMCLFEKRHFLTWNDLNPRLGRN